MPWKPTAAYHGNSHEMLREIRDIMGYHGKFEETQETPLELSGSYRSERQTVTVIVSHGGAWQPMWSRGNYHRIPWSHLCSCGMPWDPLGYGLPKPMPPHHSYRHGIPWDFPREFSMGSMGYHAKCQGIPKITRKSILFPMSFTGISWELLPHPMRSVWAPWEPMVNPNASPEAMRAHGYKP